jgi:carbonic anhydrase
MVFKDPVKIADAEIGKIYPMNARPTRPLNGRDIRATK